MDKYRHNINTIVDHVQQNVYSIQQRTKKQGNEQKGKREKQKPEKQT